MFNPFATFEPRFLAGFRQKGVQAFVQQTYDRGRLPFDNRPAYLLTHFNRLDWAREHYDVLQHDANRKVFIMDADGRFPELAAALGGRAANYYTILLVKDVKRLAKKTLEKPIRSYIDTKTNWRPSRYDEVDLDLEITYGDIFVKLFYRNNQVKERLDLFEKPIRNVL